MKRSSFNLSSCASCRRKILASFDIPPRRHPTRSYTRPSIAPKPSIDLKHIRQNPGLYEQNCLDRNYPAVSKNSWRIAELFQQWQTCQKEARPLRERLNVLHKELPRSPNKQALLDEAKTMQPKLVAFEEKEKECQSRIQELAEELPNLSSAHTPVGSTPEVVGYINEHPHPETNGSDRIYRSHVQIGSALDLLDFSAAATSSGWGWYYLKNEAALLEHALIQYALSVAMKRGWQVVSPPSMVYAHMANACGFQPRDQNGEQQIYFVEQAEKDKAKPQMVLAGTAEIPLAGMKCGEVLLDTELPLKVIGASRCYRAEAGARGVDTKGLYRVHEFTKLEMFAWALPDMSADDFAGANDDGEAFATQRISHAEQLFDEILSIQTEILQSLGLHCRVLEMPSTDLGASAARKRDIEAYFPSRRDKDEGWGEVSSTSICTDYQSRRLVTKVKVTKQKNRLDFPFTLNGTAMAVPRVLACILENFWDENDTSVRIPEVLKPWMGGMESIRASKQAKLDELSRHAVS